MKSSEEAPGPRPPVGRVRGRGRRRWGCATAVLVVVAGLLGSYTIAFRPMSDGPHDPVADPCTVLDRGTVGTVIAAAHTEHLNDQRDNCYWRPGAAAPDAPEASIVLSLIVLDAHNLRGGVSWAKLEYGSRSSAVKSPGDTESRLAGLGDEAHEYGTPPSRGNPPKTTVVTRAGNVVLEVKYEEEDANTARVSEIAQILSRSALRRVAGDKAALRGGNDGAGKRVSSREIAAVPPAPRLPSSRFARHREGRQISVIGAVYRPGERGRIQDFGYPFVFKTPAGLSCSRGSRTSCFVWPPTNARSYIRVIVYVERCPARCGAAARAKLDRSGWMEQKVTRWRTFDPTTRFAERTLPKVKIKAAPDVRSVSMLTLSHVFTVNGERHYVGAQLFVPPARAAEAQKVINDIRTQTP